MNRKLALLKLKKSDATLVLLCLVCILLMFKASTDPRPIYITNTWLEPLFTPFPTGNQIIFDLAVGVIVSLVIYLLVVRLPEVQKKQRLKAHLARQHNDFKEATLLRMLWACNGSASMALLRELMDRQRFRNYFKETVNGTDDRWSIVVNNLDRLKIEDLTHEMREFRQEIEYVLTSVDVSEEVVFDYLKGVTRILSNSERSTDDYDEKKVLGRFLWSLHTGWDPAEGYLDKDFIGEMIERI